MIMIFSFLSHKCIHSELFKNIDLKIAHSDKLKSKKTANDLRKINIYFDISQIETGYQYMCSEVGEVIEWEMGPVNCTEEDIMTPEKIQVLKSSFQNVANFFSSTLSVIPESEGQSVSNIKDHGRYEFYFDPPKNYSNDIDLVMLVAARPFGNQEIIAGASPSQISGTNYRPVVGVMYVNPRFIPLSSQDFKDVNNNYFITLCHETIHALAFSTNLYSFWIDPQTQKILSNYPLTTFTYKQKQLTIINTPALHRFVTERFGQEYYYDDNGTQILSGIELENGGGSGSDNCHFKETTYFYEIMISLTTGYDSITNATFSLLQDCGWYQVHQGELAQELLWGKDIPKFDLTSPFDYPKNYICGPEESDYDVPHCTFDNRAPSFCSPHSKVNCSSTNLSDDDHEYCFTQYYNPYNYTIRGIKLTDYGSLRIPKSSHLCFIKELQQHSNVNPGESFGENSYCAISSLSKDSEENNEYSGCYEMKCKNDHIFIKVGDEEEECPNEGATIKFNGYHGYIKCPPNNFLKCESETTTGSPKKKKLTSWEIGLIAGSAGLVLIIVVVICIVCLKKKKVSKIQSDLVTNTLL